MNDNTTSITSHALRDDRGTGLAMFVIFTAACLIVTGAVAMLALINTWWVLGLAFGIHVIMTACVGFAVFNALSDHSRAIGQTRQPNSDAGDLERSASPRAELGQAYPAAA